MLATLTLDIHMFTSLFIVGSLAFYIFTLAIFALVVGLFSSEKYGWSFIWVVVFFTALGTMGDFNLFTQFRTNPLRYLTIAAFYFLAGGAWSLVKWWALVRVASEKYQAMRTEWMKRAGFNPDEPIPVTSREQFAKHVGNYSVSTKPPSPSDHRSEIVSWIGFWPISVIIFIFDDLARHIITSIFDGLKAVYIKIAAKVFVDTSKDLPPPS